jgi:hypothetical protein
MATIFTSKRDLLKTLYALQFWYGQTTPRIRKKLLKCLNKNNLQYILDDKLDPSKLFNIGTGDGYILYRLDKNKLTYLKESDILSFKRQVQSSFEDYWAQNKHILN